MNLYSYVEARLRARRLNYAHVAILIYTSSFYQIDVSKISHFLTGHAKKLFLNRE